MQACAGFVKWKYGEIRALKLLVGERIDFAGGENLLLMG